MILQTTYGNAMEHLVFWCWLMRVFYSLFRSQLDSTKWLLFFLGSTQDKNIQIK